jgi:hypothetical protein
MGDMVPVGQLAVTANPKQVMKHAKEIADMLMLFVRDRKLSKKFGNAEAEHIFLPAWQFVGHFYGTTAAIVKTEPYTDDITGACGFKAWSEAIRADGSVASRAEAICLNDEDNWGDRPKYEWKEIKGMGREKVQTGTVRVPSFQLMSMAQTRAMSRVLSNVFRFVVVLAGYDSTPAEEMEAGKETERKSEQQAAKQQTQTQSGGNGGTQGTGPITDPMVKRVYAIRKEVNCPMVKCGEIVMSFGFNVIPAITREKYDTVVEAIRNWQTFQPAAKE